MHTHHCQCHNNEHTPNHHNHHNCNHEHGHQHHHHHDNIRHQIALIGICAILLGIAIWIEHTGSLAVWQLLLIYMVPYLLVGHDTLKEALEGIVHGDMFNEHFLMTIATLGALGIGFLPGANTEFPEAVFVMLFFQVGELFEGYAEGRSRDSISHLMEIRPDTANVVRGDAVLTVKPEEVAVGELIEIKPGEKVPLDGVITSGSTSLSTMALTGESMPRSAATGDNIMSGCINLTGAIRVRVTKTFGESTVSKIISLVESANNRKSRSESFITRFARIYTPIVVVAAVVLALVPPLFADAGFAAAFTTWLERALIFLVVSCPCALVISVPLTFFGGIGGASRHGILIKGSNYIDALAHAGTVVFDKTGTLTHGEFAVEAVHPNAISEQELLHLVAHVEHYSTHPIGIALRNAFPAEATDGCEVSDVHEVAGRGVSATVAGHQVCVGNSKMMDDIGAKWHNCHLAGTIIHVAIDGVYAGHIIITDHIKDDSRKAVSTLKAAGVQHVAMLTGDREDVARNVAATLGIDEYHAELLPTDKVEQLERMLSTRPKNSTLAFVGDGINDAPVLKRADIGIAMGALGSDAAIEAADVVLMLDKPSQIATAIGIARRTIGIAHQNVTFAIGVKVAVLALATFGLGTMWMAVFADVGVTVLAVLNAMRALRC